MMPTIAVVLPSDATSALRAPRLTEVETHIRTLGPGVTVRTKTAATYKSQVARVIEEIPQVVVELCRLT
jgi:hypothetical protein